jgi:hypothetical protein
VDTRAPTDARFPVTIAQIRGTVVSALLQIRRVQFVCSRALRMGAAHLRSIGKMLFIRYRDDPPEGVIASALADADRRGVNEICLFLSYTADPDLLRRLLEHPRVSSVGMKDRPSESPAPAGTERRPAGGKISGTRSLNSAGAVDSHLFRRIMAPDDACHAMDRYPP